MQEAERARLLDALQTFGRILVIKLYRLNADGAPRVPVLPCLDHEAMLHGGIAPHAAVYIQEASSGDLHEVVLYPTQHRIEIDTVSSWQEHSPESLARLETLLRQRLPEYRLSVHRPSWWRGERRVAEACLAQVSLRDVLLAEDVAAVSARVSRLQTISTLMEKESRVASWGVRTVTGPLLAATGAVTILAVGSLGERIGDILVALISYGVVGVLGAVFLYYGLKAVQLTEMANRVWKRTAEYSLILTERQRLAREARTEA
jgi:hypothetical protein